MGDISVSKVVKTTTDDKDSYDVLMKGQMRFDGTEAFHPDDVPSTYSEMADIELKIKGIEQRELLVENHVFRIGAVKMIDLRDVQTQLTEFTDPENTPPQVHVNVGEPDEV